MRRRCIANELKVRRVQGQLGTATVGFRDSLGFSDRRLQMQQFGTRTIGNRSRQQLGVGTIGYKENQVQVIGQMGIATNG